MITLKYTMLYLQLMRHVCNCRLKHCVVLRLILYFIIAVFEALIYILTTIVLVY